MGKLFDPNSHQRVDECSCASVIAGSDVMLLRAAPGGPWFASEVWTGHTRLLEPSEEALASAYDLREAVEARCALIEGRHWAAPVEEASADIISTTPSPEREALFACLEHYSAAVVLRAYDTLHEEPIESEAFEGIDVLRVSDLVG